MRSMHAYNATTMPRFYTEFHKHWTRALYCVAYSMCVLFFD